MHKLISLIILSTLFLSGCKTSTEPVPPEKKPPGYQEDIPWPSLADSPWPMEHHDPQSTGRSKIDGPKSGSLFWKLDSVEIRAGIAINDSAIIFFSRSQNWGMYSLKFSGDTNWVKRKDYNILDDHSTPIILSDNSFIISGGYSGRLFSFDKNGNKKWEYFAGEPIIQSALGIGMDGVIYFIGAEHTLFAVSPKGELLWSINEPDFAGLVSTKLTFSPDGKTLYIPGMNNSIYSFEIAKRTINWKFGNSTMYGAAIVDSQGNIYLNSCSTERNGNKFSFYCLTPDGKVKWSYVHDNKQSYQQYGFMEGTIDWNGNSYFAFDTLYSFDYSGALRWKVPLDGLSEASIISDAKNNVYLTVESGSGEPIKSIQSYSEKGELRWKLNIDFWALSGFSSAIDPLGNLIVPTDRYTSIFSIN